MKIERINENSIRCTLTGFDLSVRNMNIRELAYGSDKAKKLFQEMMQKASAEVGFQAENMPIMIEAIPLNGDSVQLVITKVEDPEELDTRFSRFSPSPNGTTGPNEDWIKKLTSELLEGADGFLRQIRQLSENNSSQQTAGAPNANPQTAAGNVGAIHAPSAQEVPFRVFAFDSLDRAIDASAAAAGFRGCSRLYKKPDRDSYILVIENKETDPDEFASACNLVAEYGRKVSAVPATLAYYGEHYEVLIGDHAVQKLSKI